ncbi:MAG: DNA alkylation repair protein [Clostridiales bacterium]|nr:DNA alkylation repair protein [Clostridiales bacterium]
MNKEIKKELEKLADEKYRDFHKKLCNTKYEILGVRLPILRDIAKRLAKQDWQGYILKSKDEVYEEVMIQALVIGYVKTDIEEIKKYLDIILTKIDNWAICDSMCSNLKITKNNTSTMWEYIMQKLNTKKEYLIRFSYVMMLNYYINEDYLQHILKIIDKNKQEKYYIQMAIAWLVSCTYVKFPKQTMEYLNISKLDKFTYNKSLQKIIESYRVSKDEKDTIRKMRKQ